MNFWRFWGDLSPWNKFGLAFVAAVVLIGILMMIF